MPLPEVVFVGHMLTAIDRLSELVARTEREGWMLRRSLGWRSRNEAAGGRAVGACAGAASSSYALARFRFGTRDFRPEGFARLSPRQTNAGRCDIRGSDEISGSVILCSRRSRPVGLPVMDSLPV